MNIHLPRRRLIFGAFATLVGVSAAVVVETTLPPSPAYALSAVNGQITRSEVLARAQYWVDRRFVYSPNAPASYTFEPDAAGKLYRADCSGLVSNAWHLNNSPVTGNFMNGAGPNHRLPSLHDLRPGDAIVQTGHIELFARWVNPSNHAQGAYVYSFNLPSETVRNPNAASNRGNRGFNSWSEMTSYIPIRYDRIVEDNTSVSYADGTFLREPSGAIGLVVGGMPFHLNAWEYGELGSPAYISVAEGTFQKMPGSVRNGTILRTPSNGGIFIVAGNAAYHMNAVEYGAFGSPAYVNVPVRLVDAFKPIPTDNTFLRDPASSQISQVVGAASYHLSLAEWSSLGYPGFTNVPAGFINSMPPTAPTGSHFLRDPINGGIYQTVNGAKYLLNLIEYSGLGSPGFINAPIGFINRIGSVPADYTYLRNPIDGGIYEVLRGKKSHLTAEQWAARGEVGYTNVATGFLNMIPNA